MEARSKEHFISLTNSFVKVNARKIAIIDTHREKAPSNSSAYKKYEYGYLGSW